MHVGAEGFVDRRELGFAVAKGYFFGGPEAPQCVDGIGLTILGEEPARGVWNERQKTQDDYNGSGDGSVQVLPRLVSRVSQRVQVLYKVLYCTRRPGPVFWELASVRKHRTHG